MKRVKKLKNAIWIEFAVILAVFGVCIARREFHWLVTILFINAVVFLIWLLCEIYIPLHKLAETLDYFVQPEYREEELKEAAAKIPYMEAVYRIVDLYATTKTRKNSAKMFDKQAELTALQSQINPHFLYNTLDSIRGQLLIDRNIEAAKMVEALASFFRYSISRKGNLVTLRDELANIQNYMLIQRYRFNNRFSLEVIVEEEDEAAYDFLVPRLMIQPIVENAIYHGLEEKLSGGEVVIEVIVTEQNLIITVSDNGKGIDAETLEGLNARIFSGSFELEEGERKNHRNTGIALPNVHRRIQLLFGEEYGVHVYSTVGQGTDVEITVPANAQRSGGTESEERNTANQ